MSSDRQSEDEDHGGVIPFRQRLNGANAAPRAGSDPGGSSEAPESGATRAGEDDYRHRMLTNLASVAVLTLLVAGGIWLAVAIADLRKNQDCALSGRRNCTPIEVPSRDRW